MLGYYIDVADDTLLSRLEELRRTRDRRNEMLIERLRELGIDITMDEVREHLDTVKALDETIGRPHIANALVKKGVVSSMQQAFEMYLGKGAPAYVSPERIHPRQAIDWIHEAGGTAVLAHPGLYDDDALVAELIDYGLDGIEPTTRSIRLRRRPNMPGWRRAMGCLSQPAPIFTANGKASSITPRSEQGL